jgi:hypothetical protein
MRKFFLGLMLLSGFSLQAQIPMWALHPTYDRIKPLNNGNFVVSKNGRQGIVSAQEKEILPIKYDKIEFFNGDMGLLYNDNRFVGYTNDQGEVNDVTDMGYKTYILDRFSDGYLAVKSASGYYYLSPKTVMPLGPYTEACPFSEGYAWVKVPKSAKHVLDGNYTFDVLSAQTGKPATLMLDGYGKDDIDFISTSSNHRCIIVLKKRFYEYNYNTETLTPLSTDPDGDERGRVMANERPVKVNYEGDRFSIQCKQGYLTFDPLMRLTGITYNGQPTRIFEVPQPPVVTMQSPITPASFEGTPLLGMKYLGKDVLSAQFEAIDRRWDDYALVKLNGRYGVVKFDPKHSCRFTLNGNKSIGFEHKTINSDIKVICPPFMQLPLMSLTSLDKTCAVSIDTRQESSNVETAVLSYDCTLQLPEKIGLNQTKATAKFAINYDGLTFTPAEIPFNAWYINNYTVQLRSHQYQNEELTAEFQVTNSGQHDGMNYFRVVSIEAEDESIVCTLNKVTEEIYTASFTGMTENTVRFTVNITEDGCPTIPYPFTVNLKGNIAVAGKEDDEPAESKPVVTQPRRKPVSKPKPTPKKEDKKFILK